MRKVNRMLLRKVNRMLLRKVNRMLLRKLMVRNRRRRDLPARWSKRRNGLKVKGLSVNPIGRLNWQRRPRLRLPRKPRLRLRG